MISIILWTVVFFYLQMQYGLLTGLLMGAIAWMVVTFAIGVQMHFNNKAEKEKLQDIRDNNVLITLEVVEKQGQLIYLAYNVPNNKFLGQSFKIDELAINLAQRFEGKNIYVKKDPDGIELLTTAIQKYLV